MYEPVTNPEEVLYREKMSYISNKYRLVQIIANEVQ